MTERTSETLYRAADLIEERGWTKGAGGWKDPGPVCIEGGILAALGLRWADLRWADLSWTAGDFRACPAYAAVAEYLAVVELWEWNDGVSRTAEQVIEVLRACAVTEAARETADERVRVSA